MSQTELPGGQIFRLKFRECPGGSGTVGASGLTGTVWKLANRDGYALSSFIAAIIIFGLGV